MEVEVNVLSMDGGPLPAAAVLCFEDASQDVRYNGRAAGFTPCQYRLLKTLHLHTEHVLSKPFLYQQVLNRGYARHDRSLDMHVSQIRRKLKALDYQGHELRTVWGRGYVFFAR